MAATVNNEKSGYPQHQEDGVPPPPAYNPAYQPQPQDQPAYTDHTAAPPSYPAQPVYAAPPSITSNYYGNAPSQDPAGMAPQGSNSNMHSRASSTSGNGDLKEGGEEKPEKKSFNERMYRWSNRTAPKVNKWFNKLGSEGWWPGSLDHECDKCARILKNFVHEGIYAEDSQQIPPPEEGYGPKESKLTKGPNVVKIPQKVIQNAMGIAIFTTMRTGGPYLGGMGGAGVVVARLPDGSWSPPSGILPNAVSLGFMVGLDVYDCVCILNTQEAVDAFSTKVRFSLGGTVGIAAGPVGGGAQLDTDFKKAKPVWSYARSKGFYAGVHTDGTVIVTRPDVNGDFYGEKGITADRILTGDVTAHPGEVVPEDGSKMWPDGAARLMAVLRDAEGKPADPKLLAEVDNQAPTAGQVADPDKLLAAASGAAGGPHAAGGGMSGQGSSAASSVNGDHSNGAGMDAHNQYAQPPQQPHQEEGGLGAKVAMFKKKLGKK